jgi:hypothetical protein
LEHRNPENHAAFDQLFLKMKGNGGKRSKGGLKGDKYIQQPIIVESFRLRKKGIKKNLPEIPESAFDIPEFREKVFRPRHQVVLKLSS